MKNAFVITVLATWLASCASNQTSLSAESINDSPVNKNSVETPEKVCTYETGGRLGANRRRVCRDADSD